MQGRIQKTQFLACHFINDHQTHLIMAASTTDEEPWSRFDSSHKLDIQFVRRHLRLYSSPFCSW